MAKRSKAPKVPQLSSADKSKLRSILKKVRAIGAAKRELVGDGGGTQAQLDALKREVVRTKNLADTQNRFAAAGGIRTTAQTDAFNKAQADFAAAAAKLAQFVKDNQQFKGALEDFIKNLK
jgi:hypothetical protein